MRKPRLHAPGAFYHVTLRGNHRQDIFFSPGDRTLFNEIVAEVIRRFEAHLHAYCWMTNHMHLLIQIGDTPLGPIMLRIASHYARQLQARFHTTGHLFERRYHAVLVDADAYLLELLRYIHLKIPADRRPGTIHNHSSSLDPAHHQPGTSRARLWPYRIRTAWERQASLQLSMTFNISQIPADQRPGTGHARSG